MNTNLNNLIILCLVWVSITLQNVNCNQNDNVILLKPDFGKASSYWFFNAEGANVTVSDISQSKVVNSDRKEEKLNMTVSTLSQNQGDLTYRSKEKNLTTTELATKYGYEAREHLITTKDGYRLTLFQMMSHFSDGEGPLVFLMHDFLGSSDDFVVSGPGKALAFLLADEGYNVWLGNARGNKYSRNHEFFDPDSKPFWKFSWHEIGIYDLPAMVDYAFIDNEADQLTYIGLGQGTTVFYVLTSEKPKYNRKFNLMISLGTVAWTWHMKSPVIRSLEQISDSQFQLLENRGNYEIFPASKSSKYCCSSKEAILICKTRLFNIMGYSYDQIDFDYACQQLTHFPSGSSLRQLQHYVQLIRSREFAQFDFGKQKNLATYGSKTPPSYNVEKITVPVVIFYADNDWLSNLNDVLILIKYLPNVKKVYRVPHSQFNHFDYIYGKNADQLLYWKILDVLKEKFSENEVEG